MLHEGQVLVQDLVLVANPNFNFLPVLPGQLYLPSCGLCDIGNNVHQRGFPCPIPPQQSKDFFLVHLKRDLIQCLHMPIRFLNIGYLDDNIPLHIVFLCVIIL